jgi:DNA-directed RNA polymerase subunit beta'
LGGQDYAALIAAGAYNVLRDGRTVRGQRNDDYHAAFLKGLTPPPPQEPESYRKFFAQLRAAGVGFQQKGDQVKIFPGTDREVEAQAGGRELGNAETVRLDRGMAPIPGGMFDPKLFGPGGDRFAKITLADPIPHPMMAEPIRRILGLTGKQYEQILQGQLPLGDSTGPKAIAAALGSINLDRAIADASSRAANKRGAARDLAVRQLGFLSAAKANGQNPVDWMISKIPVLPPRFRPVNLLRGTGQPLVDDTNYLYREVFEANQNYRAMKNRVADTHAERYSLYSSVKQLMGLTEPTNPKLRDKKVKGILQTIFGSSPKFSTLQRQLIGTTVDNVGRSTLLPNADLDMDEVGLPEERAWDVYRNFIVRRLKQRGLPITQAIDHVEQRSAAAKQAMTEEFQSRPILVVRAPVLHKFGVLAFKPRLVKGNAIQLPTMVYRGYNADNDGDALNYHVVTDNKAAAEALERLLPSRNLVSPADMRTAVAVPEKEFAAGLYLASLPPDPKEPVRTYADHAAMVAAYQRREIGPRTPVRILRS